MSSRSAEMSFRKGLQALEERRFLESLAFFESALNLEEKSGNPAPRIEDDVLETLPHVEPLRTAAERTAAYARRGDFVLNAQFGVERDQAARASGNGRSEPAGA